MNLLFLLNFITLSSLCIVLESKPNFPRNHYVKDVKSRERYKGIHDVFALHTRRKRQSSSSSANSAARPSTYAIPQSIPYASLSTGVVPPRLRNRLSSSRTTSESSSSAASPSESIRSSSSQSTQSSNGSPYGGRSPYMGVVPQYGNQGGVYSNPYAGYQPSVPQYSQQQHGTGPVPQGRSIYPYRTSAEARYGGLSNMGGAGYMGRGRYPQSTGFQPPQYGSTYGMTGGYSGGMNPYAAAGAYGGYGRPYQPVNQYAYPTPRGGGGGGGYYGYRFTSYPLGASIGSVYRDPSVRPLGHETGSRGSYGSSVYSSGSGRYVSGGGGRNTGGSTPSNPYSSGYGSGGNPYGGSSSYGTGRTPYTGSSGYSSDTGYGGSYGTGTGSYGGAGSFGGADTSVSNPYPGGGSTASNPYHGQQDSSSYSGTYRQYEDSNSFGSPTYGNAGDDSSSSDDSSSVPYGGGGAGSYPGQYSRENMRFNENQYSQTSGSRYGSYDNGKLYAGSQDQGGNPVEGDTNAGNGHPQGGYSYGYGNRYSGGSKSSADPGSGISVPQGSSQAGTGQTFRGYQSSSSDSSPSGSQDYQTGRYYPSQDSGSQYNYGQVPLGMNPFSQTSSSADRTYQSSQDAQTNDDSNDYYSPNGQQDTGYAIPQPAVSKPEAGKESVVGANNRTESSSSTVESETSREMIPRGNYFQNSQNNGPILVSRNRGRMNVISSPESEREVVSEIENGGAGQTKLSPSLEKCNERDDGLPDLYTDHRKMKKSVFLQRKSLTELKCAKEEGCLAPTAFGERPITTRKLLRFATITHNNGTANFVPPRPSSEWVFHTCHDHWHSMKEFAHYNLINDKGEILAEGHKASFCLQDSGCRNPCKPVFTCQKDVQSISPGCHDTYLASRDCQWIDVTDVAAGKYVLRVTVNPRINGERAVTELSYANNVVECDVTIALTMAEAHRCWLA